MRKGLLLIALALTLVVTGCSSKNPAPAVPVPDMPESKTSNPLSSALKKAEVSPTTTDGLSLYDTLILEWDTKIDYLLYSRNEMDGLPPSKGTSYISLEYHGDEIEELLKTIHIQGDVEQLSEKPRHSNEVAFFFTVRTSPELETFCDFMPDGTVFLRAYSAVINEPMKELGWYSFKITPEDYETILQCAEGLVDTVRSDMRNLFGAYVSPHTYAPSTEVIQFSISNSYTDLTLAVTDLTFEKKTGDVWQPLTHTVELTDKVLPNGLTYFSVDIDEIENGRAEGEYRFSANLEAPDGSKKDVSGTYTIDPSGTSSVKPPESTPEMKKYAETYLRPWSFSEVYTQDFDKAHYLERYDIHLLSSPIFYAQKKDDSTSDYMEYTPAEQMETALQSRFYFSTEELRKSHYYSAEQHGYKAPQGFGGRAPEPIVIKLIEENNTLILLADWYLYDNHEVVYSHTTVSMFDLEKDGNFKVAANKFYEDKLPEDFDLKSVFA